METKTAIYPLSVQVTDIRRCYSCKSLYRSEPLNFSDQHRLGVPPSNLLIGMGILRQMHIYIAYRENNIYFTSAADQH